MRVQKVYSITVRCLAVMALLHAMPVYAEEPELTGLETPATEVEIAEPAQESTEVGTQVVETARAVYGSARYEMGKSSAEAVDCSSLVQRSYEAAGVKLPRTAAEQFHAGNEVTDGDYRSGDLLFYRWTGGPQLHVVIYTGEGRAIHASTSRRRVFETRVDTKIWRQRFVKAVRIETPAL